MRKVEILSWTAGRCVLWGRCDDAAEISRLLKPLFITLKSHPKGSQTNFEASFRTKRTLSPLQVVMQLVRLLPDGHRMKQEVDMALDCVSETMTPMHYHLREIIISTYRQVRCTSLDRYPPPLHRRWPPAAIRMHLLYFKAQKQTALFESRLTHTFKINSRCLTCNAYVFAFVGEQMWPILWWDINSRRRWIRVQFSVRLIDGDKNTCGCSSWMSFGSQRNASRCMLGSGCSRWKMTSAPI